LWRKLLLLQHCIWSPNEVEYCLVSSATNTVEISGKVEQEAADMAEGVGVADGGAAAEAGAGGTAVASIQRKSPAAA
jgi:hypothetical protein